MENTLTQAGSLQKPELVNGRLRVAKAGQDREVRLFLAAVTVVSIVALYYLQLDWLKLLTVCLIWGRPSAFWHCLIFMSSA